MSTEDQISLKNLALVSKSAPHLHPPELRVPYKCSEDPYGKISHKGLAYFISRNIGGLSSPKGS